MSEPSVAGMTSVDASGAGAGLVIGDRVARLVMLRTGPDGTPQANQWTEVFPAGAVRDGRIQDADAVRAALEVLARRADPLLASVTTWLGIHPASSVVQALDLAGLPAADADRRLGEFAAELGDGMVGGWEIRRRAGRIRALIVAAPRVEVVKAAELAEAAGFRVGGMELVPVALVRAVARDSQPAGFAVYGLGQGGGRSAVAWRSGTPVLGGRLWPPAAGDAGLSVHAVPPADLDLLTAHGAGFANGALGFAVDVGLESDPGLGLERLLATLGAGLPHGPEVDAPALGLALVASGRVDAPVDLLAAAGAAPPPPGAILIDLRTPAADGVIDLTTPTSAAPGTTGPGPAALAAVGLGAAAGASALGAATAGTAGAADATAFATGAGSAEVGAAPEVGAASLLPVPVLPVAPPTVDPLIDEAIARSAGGPAAAPLGSPGSTAVQPQRRPLGWVALFGAGAGTLLFGGLAAFAVSRSGSEESAATGPDPVTRSTGRVVGKAVPTPPESTATPSPAPTNGVSTTSAAGVGEPGPVQTQPLSPSSTEPSVTTVAPSAPSSVAAPPETATTGTPQPSTPASTPSSTTSAAPPVTTAPPSVPPAPVPTAPAPAAGASTAAEKWASTVDLRVDRSVGTGQTAVLSAGRLTVSGAVPSAPAGQEVLVTAAELVGPDKVVVALVVNPDVKESPTTGNVVVQDNVLFAFGSAELLPAYTELLDLEARALLAHPEAVIVVGAHTDSIGPEDYNLALSQERANAVRDHLVSNGVSPAQIVVEAKGESEPVADNATPEGRQLNRRVCTELQGVLDS